jgi:hypothetical protein
MVKEKSEKWKFKIDLQRCLLKAIPQGFSSTALIINAKISRMSSSQEIREMKLH